jgi:hypothetical protein
MGGSKSCRNSKEEKKISQFQEKKDEFYEWRMDMTTEKRFAHNDFVEALDYVGVFNEDKK